MINSELSPFRLIECCDSAAAKFSPAIERTGYPVCNLEYVLHGYGYLKCAGHFWKLAPGDIYIMRKYESHRYWQDRDDPWEKRFMIADGPLMEQIIAGTLSADDYVFRNCQSLKHYFDTFFVMARNYNGTPPEAGLLFHQLVFDLAQHRENLQNDPLNLPEYRLKSELDKAVERSFLLEDYAEKAGYSKSYLIRKFRQSFGVTPYDYLLLAKIRKSQELLRYSTLQVKEIADQLGFADQSAFSRCFKLKTGQSPKQCRERPVRLPGGSMPA